MSFGAALRETLGNRILVIYENKEQRSRHQMGVMGVTGIQCDDDVI